MSAFYIILAIIAFGLLIAVHEFGHFFTAKLLGVRVNEFAIGMGPALWHRQRGETQYSLRLFPIGGYCAMEGEDEDSDDPRAMYAQPMWKKFIILVAGSFMNFLAGFMIILVLFTQAEAFSVPVISGFLDGFPSELQGESGLLPGDRILEINGERVYIFNDVSLLMSRAKGGNVNLLLKRNGRTVALNNYPLILRDFTVDGQKTQKYGLTFEAQQATVGARLKQTWLNSVDFVRLVRLGLTDIFSGAAGADEVSGPVGIVNTVSNVGKQSASVADALMNIAYLMALIAINLAVMNMLPFPALDGGRIFFMLVTGAITAVTRRKVNPKVEGYVHFAGFVVLILIMVAVTFNDITKLFA